MVQNKKMTAIVLVALVAVIGIVVAVMSLSGKDDTAAPSATPTTNPSPTIVGEKDPGANEVTPTIPAVDYTDETITFTEEMPDVVFSHNSYFYDEGIDLRIYTRYDAKIYYTLDGTNPTTESLEYDRARGISLFAGMGSTPKVYNIKTLAVYEDGTDSGVFSHGYFLGAKVTSRYETLIFNISGNPADLTKGPNGIFYGDNCFLRGRSSERPVYLEVVTGDGELISSQSLGIRIYGGASRGSSQKSMKFFARKSYGSETGSFYLNCFDCPAFDGTNVVRFDKFVLRNSGNDFRFAFIRDELNQTLAAEAGYADYHSVVPAIAYMNGQYFGFYWLHTTYCDEFFKDRYGASPAEEAAEDGATFLEGEFVVLEGGDTFKSESADDEITTKIGNDYQEQYWVYAQSDLTDDKIFKELTEWMDVPNYLDYMALNIYLCNKDWPQNNYKCYRYFPAEGESLGEGAYDGRWRYLLHDMDYTHGMYGQNEVLATYNTLKQVLNTYSERYSPLLAALLLREDCQEYFVTKSLDIANGVFRADNVIDTLETMHEERANEMTPYYNYLISLGKEDVSWINESQLPDRLQEIRDFANQRPGRSISHIQSYFGLGGTYKLRIDARDAAKYQINSYLSDAGEAFLGTYFECYATTVSPVLPQGTTFDYWEVNGEKVTEETLVLTEEQIVSGEIRLMLHTKADTTESIFISGVSANGQDFVHIINRGSEAVNLSGYLLTDGNYDYPIPEGTTLAAGATLTIYCNNYTDELPEDALICIYNLSEGETVTLKDTSGTELDSVTLPGLHSGFVYTRDWYTMKFYEVKAE